MVGADQSTLGAATMTRVLLMMLYAGLTITPDGNCLTVGTSTFAIAPAESIVVENEPYVLSSDKPDRWIKGTHLKGCLSQVTVLPGCLVPGSVVVKTTDG